MRDEPATADAVMVERRFAASPQTVFDAWTKPEMLRRWWHAEHHWETPLAEVDLRVGGEIVLVMRNPGSGAELAGRGYFTALVPGERVGFTWTWDDLGQPGLVDVELRAPVSSSGTQLVLTHYGVPVDSRNSTYVGWQNSFDNLDLALAG